MGESALRIAAGFRLRRLPQDTADSGMRILQVLHRVILTLRLGQIEIKVELLL